MKKILLLATVCFLTATSFAQSEKFTKAMEQKLAGFDSVRSSAGLQELANSFERIADAEKTQWLPYYYAALSNINLAFGIAMEAGPLGGNADQVDPLADKAEKLLDKAEALSKDNSEIYIVRKIIASTRMMGDVMNRYMTYGAASAEALAKAKKLNPNNPRVYLLQGTDDFTTPEQFGGSKTKAAEQFAEAKAKFDSYKIESTIHPDWGRGQLNYFMNQSK